jgi:hypothetical protein
MILSPKHSKSRDAQNRTKNMSKGFRPANNSNDNDGHDDEFDEEMEGYFERALSNFKK